MKIRMAESHGHLQFIVTAESDEERILLGIFVGEGFKKYALFHLHGYGKTCDGRPGYDHFNFGDMTHDPDKFVKLKKKQAKKRSKR